MAEGVRGGVYREAGHGGVVAHQALDGAGGEAVLGVFFIVLIVDKEGREEVLSGFEVLGKPMDGALGKIDDAGRAAFAADADFNISYFFIDNIFNIKQSYIKRR